MTRSLRLPLLLLLVVLLSCRDDSTAPHVEPDQPPEGLVVIAPDTVRRGEAFTLRIDALDEEGLPATGWSGTVTLSSSNGSITPEEVELTNGTATVQATIGGYAGAVTLTASVGAVQSDPSALTVLSTEAPVRIEIVPAAALLPGVGDTLQFAARAYDASGALTTAQVTWRTTNGATVAVAATGVATAQAIGSAQVIAAADGVESAPAVVIVAEPAGNVVLVTDSQIVSGPAAVDRAAAYEPGWQYRVVVQNASPAVGDLVLGTGGVPLAGRVAGSRSVAAGTELTVELVALNQLFTHLVIDETIPLVELEGNAGGGVGRARGFDGARLGAAAATFNLGPFECEADGSIPDLDLPTPDLDITPNLGLRIRYNDGLQELVVTGQLKADFSFRPVLEVTFEGKISCDAELHTLTLPLNGWFAKFYGVQVPVGIGFELDATLEVAEVGFDLSANATATAELGLTCTGGNCTGVNKFDLTRDADFEFISPDPTEQYRVELGLQPYVFANPKLGSVLTDALDYDLIEAQVGLKQTVDLAAPHRQVEDTAYSSYFDLRLIRDVKAADDLQKGIDSLGKLMGEAMKALFDALSDEDTLATSPKGTLTITPPTVAPGDSTQLGDLAKFTVQLDGSTYLGLDAVDQVEFLWQRPDTALDAGESDSFILENGRPPCTILEASSGQTKFECEADFLREHEGEQPFHAFLHPRLFGIPLPVPLELAVDTVTVVGSCNIPPPDFEYWGPAGVFVEHTEDDAGGSVSAEVVAATPSRLSYRASIRGDNSNNWVSARADMYVDDYLTFEPLEPFTGFLTIHIDTYVRGEQSAYAENVETRAVGGNGLAGVGVNLEGRPEDPLFIERDTTVDVLLDNDIARIEGNWIRMRHWIGPYVRTRGEGRTGSVSAESRMDILDYATDSNGRQIPIRICSAIGASY